MHAGGWRTGAWMPISWLVSSRPSAGLGSVMYAGGCCQGWLAVEVTQPYRYLGNGLSPASEALESWLSEEEPWRGERGRHALVPHRACRSVKDHHLCPHTHAHTHMHPAHMACICWPHTDCMCIHIMHHPMHVHISTAHRSRHLIHTLYINHTHVHTSHTCLQ